MNERLLVHADVNNVKGGDDSIALVTEALSRCGNSPKILADRLGTSRQMIWGWKKGTKVPSYIAVVALRAIVIFG